MAWDRAGGAPYRQWLPGKLRCGNSLQLAVCNLCVRPVVLQTATPTRWNRNQHLEARVHWGRRRPAPAEAVGRRGREVVGGIAGPSQKRVSRIAKRSVGSPEQRPGGGTVDRFYRFSGPGRSHENEDASVLIGSSAGGSGRKLTVPNSTGQLFGHSQYHPDWC